MARIRSIKPYFWSSEQVMSCSRDARLLFIGIWNFADDRGRYVASARTIKAQVLPGDDDATAPKVQRWLDELSANGLLRFYDVDGKKYLIVTGWHHQKIDKPQEPKYPAPLDDNSTNGQRTLATERIGEERIGEERIGGGEERTPPRAGEKLSEDWKPSAAVLAKVKALGLTDDDIAKAIPKFVANYRAKGTKREDWDAQFEAWCLGDAEKLNRKKPADPNAVQIKLNRILITPESHPEQWAAWAKARGGRSLPMNSEFGWYVESEWPHGHEPAAASRPPKPPKPPKKDEAA